MKRLACIVSVVVLAVIFIVSALAQWHFARIIRDDVAYLGERMVNAPNEMPWPRSESSFPYGAHEELGLHSKSMSVFTAINQLSAMALVAVLSVILGIRPRLKEK